MSIEKLFLNQEKPLSRTNDSLLSQAVCPFLHQFALLSKAQNFAELPGNLDEISLQGGAIRGAGTDGCLK